MALDPWHKQYDAELSSDMMGQECAWHLATKGFCVVDSGLTEEDCEKAVADVDEMDSMGKFSTPAQLIAEGLFGAEGSSRIAEMDEPNDLSTDGPNIRKLDDLMSDVCANVIDYVDEFQEFGFRSRTHGLVHETDTSLSEVPDLSEKQASVWLNTFVRAKVVVIICLGPTKGTMELRPFEDDEAEAWEVETHPGQMLIIRSDMLYTKHFAHGKVYLLTCHVLEPKHLDKRTSRAASIKMTPPTRAIDNWCLERLQVLKSAQDYGQELKDIPMDFKRAMNQVCYKGQRIAIRTVGSKLVSAYDARKWYSGMHGGPDMVQGINNKWNHEAIYDPDPEGWRRLKTFQKHCAFADGLDLFDNKFFGLSPAEAVSMDPHQTSVLEAGYEALHKCGYKKKTIMNTVGGVYVGSTSTDWAFVEKTVTSAGATGGSPSITSNRFSFCLGLKGPSLTVDSEGASGLLAVHLGSEGVLDKGRGVPNAYSVAGGVHFNLSASWWPQLQAAGLLSQTGRVMTFDESADGYVKGDGIILYCIKRLTEVVDGQTMIVENEPLLGILASSYMNNNGFGASMGAPSAVSEQEMIVTALRNSSISAADVEVIEPCGDGNYLGDAIEAGAFMRALRYDEDSVGNPLMVTAVRSNTGDSGHCAGALSLLRAMLSNSTGTVTPNCHLHALNPHMEFADQTINIATEPLEHRLNVSYHSVTAKGFGGTNVHAIVWGRTEVSRIESREPELNRKRITYWPGGGGQLDDDVVPRKKAGYFIAGTWNRWTPEQMEPEGENSFGYTMVLGENRWEKFQIFLDGSEKRKLHPGRPNETRKGGEVFGPAEDAMGCKWAIDGRSFPIEGGPLAITQEPASGDSQAAPAAEELNIDRGRPGDTYRIHLRVAGKFRTVWWERRALPEGARPPASIKEGSYAVWASWSSWSYSEMFRDDSEPGAYYLEVSLNDKGGYFCIVRNEDVEQVIYPDRYGADETATILGPDELAEELFWFIDGNPGDTFRIEFNRKDEFGVDTKKVSWKRAALKDG